MRPGRGLKWHPLCPEKTGKDSVNQGQKIPRNHGLWFLRKEGSPASLSTGGTEGLPTGGVSLMVIVSTKLGVREDRGGKWYFRRPVSSKTLVARRLKPIRNQGPLEF